MERRNNRAVERRKPVSIRLLGDFHGFNKMSTMLFLPPSAEEDGLESGNNMSVVINKAVKQLAAN